MPSFAGTPAARRDVRNSLGALDQLIGDQPYLAGDSLSLADLHLAPVFSYFTATPESAPILAFEHKLRGETTGEIARRL